MDGHFAVVSRVNYGGFGAKAEAVRDAGGSGRAASAPKVSALTASDPRLCGVTRAPRRSSSSARRKNDATHPRRLPRAALRALRRLRAGGQDAAARPGQAPPVDALVRGRRPPRCVTLSCGATAPSSAASGRSTCRSARSRRCAARAAVTAPILVAHSGVVLFDRVCKYFEPERLCVAEMRTQNQWHVLEDRNVEAGAR